VEAAFEFDADGQLSSEKGDEQRLEILSDSQPEASPQNDQAEIPPGTVFEEVLSIHPEEEP